MTAGQAYARPQEISSQHFAFYETPGSSRHESDVSDLFGVCPAFPANREDGGRYIERTRRRRGDSSYTKTCAGIYGIFPPPHVNVLYISSSKCTIHVRTTYTMHYRTCVLPATWPKKVMNHVSVKKRRKGKGDSKHIYK